MDPEETIPSGRALLTESIERQRAAVRDAAAEAVRLRRETDDDGPGDVAAEPVVAPVTLPSDAEVHAWLLDEIREQAAILGVDVSALTHRWVASQGGGDIASWPTRVLRSVVAAFRSPACAALRRAGRLSEASAYLDVRPGEAMPLDRLLGRI